MIPALKNPVKFLFNYPPTIQERVRGLAEYEGRIPTQEARVGKMLLATLLFVAVGVGLCFWADATNFRSAFLHMPAIFTL